MSRFVCPNCETMQDDPCPICVYPGKPKRDLEDELHKTPLLITKCKVSEYAIKLYSALCNVLWYTELSNISWSCSWRVAGGIVAELRNVGEDYLDFYCSGNEGYVDPEIESDLAALGWKWKDYPKEEIKDTKAS